MPEFSLPRHVDSVAIGCEAAEVLLVDAGWTEADRTRVVLAMGEAVANAVEHGTAPDNLIHLRLDLDGSALSICIFDGGTGPDPTRLVNASLPDEQMATEGRGLYILRSVADEVSIDAQGALCVTVRARS